MYTILKHDADNNMKYSGMLQMLLGAWEPNIVDKEPSIPCWFYVLVVRRYLTWVSYGGQLRPLDWTAPEIRWLVRTSAMNWLGPNGCPNSSNGWLNSLLGGLSCVATAYSTTMAYKIRRVVLVDFIEAHFWWASIHCNYLKKNLMGRHLIFRQLAMHSIHYFCYTSSRYMPEVSKWVESSTFLDLQYKTIWQVKSFMV